MNCPRDFVLLRVDQKTDDRTPSGLYLYNGKLAFNDSTYNPNDRVRIYGEVVGLPKSLSNDAMDYSSHLLSECDIEVEIGDKAYFYYIAFSDENIINHEGKMYLKIRYDSIICVVRNGEIKTIAGHVLLIPAKKTEIFLAYSVEKKRDLTGVVFAAPTPYIGEDIEFSKGDTVHFYQDSEFENEIEGNKYYVMRQEYIIAKVS